MNWDIYKAWFYQIDGIHKKRKSILFGDYHLIGKDANYNKKDSKNGNEIENEIGHENESFNQMTLLDYYDVIFDRQDNYKELSPREVYELNDSELLVYIKQIYNDFHILEKYAISDRNHILEEKKISTPYSLAEKYSKQGICFLDYSSLEYPNSLRSIPDAPIALYQMGKGKLNQLGLPSVAVIGARQCTEYGRYVANQIGEMCAFHGIHVVSGLAYGIDSYAQESARKHGGEVTAVLGSGVNVCYPKQNFNLYEDLISNGTVFSENKPDTKPLAYHFPPRNRIISGLADAVIVVEAKKKSGTLITVDMALEQGKDVYLVPGRITDPLSYGCNRLIGQGGEVMYDLEKTLLEIKCKYLQRCLELDFEKKGNANHKNATFSNLPINPYHASTVESMIWDSISVMGISADDLYQHVSQNKAMPLQEFLQCLLRMEMEGTIEEHGGLYTCI